MNEDVSVTDRDRFPPRILSGLIGRNIQKSLSPWLHEREAEAQGVRLTYSLFDFAARDEGETDLAPLLDALTRIGFAGCNVTYPYKQAIMPLLDDLSEAARRIGAVNTIAIRDGRSTGHNTDAIGFAAAMRAGLPGVAMGRVVQLGAGGAGYATAHALLDLGITQLAIVDSDTARAEALVARLTESFGADRAMVCDDMMAQVAQADGIVNATPVGMADVPGSALPLGLLRPDLWVSDIIYVPIETELLRAAKALGCRTLHGGHMVVFQAAAAFAIITGREADAARMLASFAQAIGQPG